MTMRTTETKRSKHSIPNFEVRSVLLFAALSMGSATAVQAQMSASALANASRASVQRGSSGVADTPPPNQRTSKNLEDAFNRADTDRDGKLNRKESGHFPVLAHRFEQIDRNGDSFLSRDEFSQAAAGD